MKTDKIKEIVDQHYKGIEIPTGLEDRISATIDRLAAEEQAGCGIEKKNRKIRLLQRPTLIKTLAIAASVALIISLAVTWPVKEDPVYLADTCTDVDQAYRETEKVLEYVSRLMNKGVDKVSETSSNISAIKTINKYIEIKEK